MTAAAVALHTNGSAVAVMPPSRGGHVFMAKFRGDGRVVDHWAKPPVVWQHWRGRWVGGPCRRRYRLRLRGWRHVGRAQPVRHQPRWRVVHVPLADRHSREVASKEGAVGTRVGRLWVIPRRIVRSVGHCPRPGRGGRRRHATAGWWCRRRRLPADGQQRQALQHLPPHSQQEGLRHERQPLPREGGVRDAMHPEETPSEERRGRHDRRRQRWRAVGRRQGGR